MQSLKELLQEQLRDLYDAETRFTAKLPEMIDSATDPQLRGALLEIADDTQDKIWKIEEACGLLSVPPTGVVCEAMKGLVREVADTVRSSGDSATVDASIIANAQRIAHYEIAGFGTAQEFARCLRESEAREILSMLTALAKSHDRMLSRIATGGWFTMGVNQEAAASV